jgi:hypothetical protein
MESQLSIYFNTVPLGGRELAEAALKVGTQNREILEFFRNHQGRDFTPFEVAEATEIVAPITSIRRAINTLTELGWLEKTGNTRPGPYGSANNTWRYGKH